MIPHHGKGQELCRTCQASLNTTVRRQEEIWFSLQHHNNWEAHILWWSHLLVCVLRISHGRPNASSGGFVKAQIWLLIMWQILTHFSDKRRCGSKTVCQAYQVERGNRICQENKVFHFDLPLETWSLGANFQEWELGLALLLGSLIFSTQVCFTPVLLV